MGPHGCHVSTYSTVRKGSPYAQVGWSANGKAFRALAHRVAYESLHGVIPAGMTVDHACFNTRCVNPDHLRLMSLAENSGRRRPR